LAAAAHRMAALCAVEGVRRGLLDSELQLIRSVFYAP
jgi:hypothetical protein